MMPDGADPVDYLNDNPDRPVDLALELLRHDTQNPPGETASLADWVEGVFSTLEVATERVTVDPAKPNLLARLPGTSDGALCLLGHLDTVPVTDSDWEFDPFGERVDDRVYGRGATDMKGAIASMLATVEAFVETGTTPPISLIVVLVSDEETGGKAGLPAVLETTGIAADACVIGEPTCEANRHSVTVADRGSIWLTLEARGTAAHGSRPTLGENAIDRLYQAVETLRSRFGERALSLPAAIDPVIEETVEYYTPIMGAEAADGLFRTPSINLGTIEGGEAINTVPRSARAEIDIRVSPGVETETVLADIRACAEDCSGVHIADVSWSVGSYTPLESPIVDAVTSVAETVTGERIYRRSATGGGDAKQLRHRGLPTVEFALGTDTVHAVDEYTTVAILRQNAEIYTRLPAGLAGGLA